MYLLSLSIYLFVIGWVLVLLHRINHKSGINWLISVLAGLLGLIAWGVFGSLKEVAWQFDLASIPFGFPASFSLGMDRIARVSGILGLAYLVYILNTWMVNLEQPGIFSRIKNLMISAAILIPLISAQNEFSYLLILVLADFYGLLQRLTQFNRLKNIKRIFTALFLRFFAVSLFMSGWLLFQNESAASVYSQETMFLAMLLHLWSGLVEITPDPKQAEDERFGAYEEIPLYLLGQLVYFIRFPIGTVLPSLLQTLFTLGTILLVFHLIQWLRENEYPSSIDHFLQTEILLIILASQKFSQSGMFVLLFAFLIIISLIYFRPVNHRHYRWFLIPILILLLGLPYLPTAALWSGQSASAWGLLLVYGCILMGIRSRFMVISGPQKAYERWMLAIYPIGFLPFLLGIVYLAILKDMPIGQEILSYSLVAAGAFLLFTGYEFLRYKKILRFDESTQWMRSLFDLLWQRLGRVFDTGWIGRVLGFFSTIIARILLFINGILEGDGGLLWSIVLLILFLSLVRTIGS